MTDKSKERIARIIEEASKLTDLVSLQAYVGRKTRYGRKPHPDDQWHFTREFLVKYDDEASFDDLVRLFSEAGATSDAQAALLVAQNIEHIR